MLRCPAWKYVVQLRRLQRIFILHQIVYGVQTRLLVAQSQFGISPEDLAERQIGCGLKGQILIRVRNHIFWAWRKIG